MAKNYIYASLLDYYGELLSQKQRELIDMYYNEDLSLAEIAENTDITRQGVHTSIKHGEQLLKEYESKLHFFEKVNLLKELAEKNDTDKIYEFIDKL